MCACMHLQGDSPPPLPLFPPTRPAGAQFGYQPGGWGKPPVDEEGNPLYGDVFGQHLNDVDSDEEVDKVGAPLILLLPCVFSMFWV